jgi:glycosyltransferase involved in cell wall biosynthesis
VRVLIDYRAALRERSGVGEYTHQLVRALLGLAQSGTPPAALQVALFSSSARDRLRPDPALAGATTVDRHVPVRLLNFAWHRLGWPPAEQLAGMSIDVTHSMHPLIMPARRAAQVVTIHDLNFLLHPERTRAEVRRDYPALAHAHAHRADQVVVVSRFTAGEVQRLLGVPAERISICSPGGPGWPPRGRRPNDGYVLFFGTLEPRKNLGALLDAYELLAARRATLPQLLVAGKPTEQSAPWLQRIARAPLSRHVRHVGYVEPDQRRGLYEGARLLVQPSFEEGFGLPVLEAMTVGVPVVAANAGALPEVGGDAVLLADPHDPSAIADAIERLLDDPGMAETCVTRGFGRASTYTWTETARSAVRAYQAALQNRAAKTGRH